MAVAAREALDLDGVVFVPCAVSPFKVGTIATATQRQRLLEIALEESGIDWATVSDFEVKRPAPSYSWQTALHFFQSRPDTRWHWILGTDQWEQITLWAEPERLREMLHFIVFSRHGTRVIDRPGWHYTAVPFEHPASSTAIRSAFADHADWLTPGVRDFCEAGGIYERG